MNSNDKLTNQINLDNYRYNAVSIDANLKAWGLDEDYEFLKSLTACGYNYLKPQKDYPFQCIVCIDRAIIARCLPGLSEREAGLAMGRRFYDGLRMTVLGRVLTAAFKVMSVERALTSLVAGFNRSAGFGKRIIVSLADGHCVITSTDDAAATEIVTSYIWLGLYQQFLEVSGVKLVQSQVYTNGPLSFTIELDWEEA